MCETRMCVYGVLMGVRTTAYGHDYCQLPSERAPHSCKDQQRGYSAPKAAQRIVHLARQGVDAEEGSMGRCGGRG